MEYIDIYDFSGKPTGKSVPRGTQMGAGEYFRSVLAVIFGADGRMLIQQRASEKQHWPGLWDFSCCGALSAGEDSRQAAMRELKEELGVTVDLRRTRINFTNAFSTGTNDTFILNLELDPAALELQREEVQAVRYATEREILEMIENGSFMPYKPAWVSLLFACRDSLGTMNA